MSAVERGPGEGAISLWGPSPRPHAGGFAPDPHGGSVAGVHGAESRRGRLVLRVGNHRRCRAPGVATREAVWAGAGPEPCNWPGRPVAVSCAEPSRPPLAPCLSALVGHGAAWGDGFRRRNIPLMARVARELIHSVRPTPGYAGRGPLGAAGVGQV